MKEQTKKIIIGFVLGIIFPILVVGLINLGLVLFNKYLTTEIFQSTLLFGIGVNAILVWFFFKGKRELMGRGMMISSFFIFIYWVIQFMLLE